MRAMLRAAALLLLAGCSVPLDGGKCTTDQNCPSDQRCSDGTCVACVPDSTCPAQDASCADATTLRECRTNSASCRYLAQETSCAPEFCVASPNSATCGCPPDGTSAGQGCAGATVGDLRCDSNAANVDILACTVDATSGCHMWLAAPGTTCSSQKKLCGTRSGAPACECPANPGSDFFADSDSGSATDALPYATGVTDPPDCRIRTLTQALSKAASYASGPPTRSSAVRATGWSSGEKVFSQAKGETYPLAVQPNVTLTTSDATPAPGNYVIVLDDATAPAAVNLREGGTVSGLIVRSTAGLGDGIALACGAASPSAAIAAVDVEGAGNLQYGIDVKGTCGAVMTGVTAAGAASAALVVNSASSSVATTITGGAFKTSAIGMKIVQGTVTLSGTEVASNASASAGGVGLQVGDGTKDVTVVASGLSIHDNDDTGLIVKTTSGSSVSITGATIRSNRTSTTASQYGPVGNIRKAGGIILWGQSPGTFVFQNSKVYSNSNDQVGVYLSAGTWNLSGGTSGAACGATANTFTCRDVANGGYAVYSTGASVAAGYDYWQNDPPLSQDVNGPVNTANSCGMSSITCP